MKRVGGLIIVGIIILIPVLIAFYWQSKEFKYTELPVVDVRVEDSRTVK